jgi:hypothetical protein
MSTVYGHANRVIVWLGEASHDSDMVMHDEVLESVLRELGQVDGHVPPMQLPDLGLPDQSDCLWPAIGNLLLLQWFSRLWIIQEVVLAQKVEVLCGRFCGLGTAGASERQH